MPKIISAEEKRLREQFIIENAIEMFEELNFSEITMNALAKKCKLAKGTLFLYFPTKETLFAKLLYKEYSEWGIHELEELRKYPKFTKEEYKKFIMDQTKYLLKERMRMIRLVSMKRSIIDKNIAPQILAEEIEGLNKTVRILSKITQRKIDFLTEDKIYHLYMARHVIIIGAYELATSPYNIEKLAEINKTNLAVIETEDIVLKMTQEYLNLYCQS
jgi:AcrR family transcriptional regulator